MSTMQRVRGISSSRVTVAIGTYQLDRRNQKIQKTMSTLPRAIVGELLCPLQVTAWNRPVKQNMPSRVLVLCFIFFGPYATSSRRRRAPFPVWAPYCYDSAWFRGATPASSVTSGGVVNQLPAEPHNRNHRFILSTITKLNTTQTSQKQHKYRTHISAASVLYRSVPTLPVAATLKFKFSCATQQKCSPATILLHDDAIPLPQ
ncbi:hypothetical protein ACLKA6_000916 [Drosophila palustris]